MRKQYCKICGTLLPEDGVCLRCGAVYHFADDGTAIEPVRKVKKITVKPAKKKGIIVKKAIDPSEAETKTIPIPEEIFSHSDQTIHNEKHTDWTDTQNDDVPFHKTPEYKPNFVLVDEEPFYEEEPRQSSYTEPTYRTRTKEPPEYEASQKRPSPKEEKSPISTGTLTGIFLLSALLAGIVMFLILGNRTNQNAVQLGNETQAISNTISSETTTTTSTTETPLTFSVKTMTYSSGDEGDFTSSYSFDKSTGKLTINNSSWGLAYPVLLPLIEGDSMAGKHLSLSTISEDMYGSYEELLCESELITKEIVKEIHVIQSVGNIEQETIFQFSVESGRLTRAYVTIKSEYYSGDLDDSSKDTTITIIDYAYDSKNRLVAINSETDEEEGLHWSIKKDVGYSTDGYVTKVVSKTDGLDGDGTDRKKLFYTNNNLSKVTTGDTSAEFSYDDKGRVSEIRYASNWGDSVSYMRFSYTDSNQFSEIRTGHSYGSTTFVYNHE